jgi:hypothetical protein
MKVKKPKHVLAPLAIKSINRPAEKGTIPTLLVDGNYPTRYNEAVAAKKAAEELLGLLRPIMQPDAVSEICRHNAEKPWDAIASVRLEDEQHSTTLVSWTSAYAVLDEAGIKAAEDLFRRIRKQDGHVPEINDYLSRHLVPKFDTKCFMGPDGKFDQQRYDVIVEALSAACERFGIPNPLSTEEAALVLPDFHERRCRDFDAATNQEIGAVIKNTVRFTPGATAGSTAEQ